MIGRPAPSAAGRAAFGPLEELGRDPAPGMPVARVANAYVESIEGDRNGDVIDARDFA